MVEARTARPGRAAHRLAHRTPCARPLVLGGHRRRNDSHAPRDTSDQVLIAAAWSKAAALAEVRAVEPVAIEKPQIAESVAPSSAPQEAAAGPGGWRKVVLGFDDSAQPELASFDGSGVLVPVAEPAPVPILVELDPLVQAPPIASEPTYLSLFGAIGRHSLAQYARKPARRGVTQRARFRSSIKRYLLTCHQRKPRFAGRPYSSRRHAQSARQGLAWGCAPSQTRRAAGPPLRAPGQQALLFGVRIEQHTRQTARHITAELAEAEPLRDRLFSRPARPMSPATRAAFARIEALRIARKPEKRAA